VWDLLGLLSCGRVYCAAEAGGDAVEREMGIVVWTRRRTEDCKLRRYISTRGEGGEIHLHLAECTHVPRLESNVVSPSDISRGLAHHIVHG
jgi:hypothetical protein